MHTTAKPHRWVIDEPDIPFEFTVLYEDERIIVIDKPHFLPTTPRGMWYRSTALIRLRERYDEPQITPAHRLDRDTAGVVVFVRDPLARGRYQMLFQEHRTTKTYECVAPARPITRPRFGTIERLDAPRVFPLRRRSRIVKDRGILQAYEEPGLVNAETVIELGVDGGCLGDRFEDNRSGNGRSANSRSADDRSGVCHTGGRLEHDRFAVDRANDWPMGDRSLVTACPMRAYTLRPRTGKTHQLRVHMNSLGLPIKGDPMYPTIIDRAYDDFLNPLQLVARTLEFTDPYTGENRRFVSQAPLDV
ncbi:23S rRNA pseudouridylate synthase [Bifidobacterium callimiconis]|uniref:pseudouridine synthase n=1 Tax=Bifidobacterium callimiconis TaxID=2306973 RepID=UPI001BDC91A3|nr:pseudouridine synthase [Bifidobacterium callimiconis]MBT1177520.1 23S rRNA pseudouridylate synthase [Bifidobacterium callimiconis]